MLKTHQHLVIFHFIIIYDLTIISFASYLGIIIQWHTSLPDSMLSEVRLAS